MIRNPIPMGTATAANQATPADKATMISAYASRGGRASAARRRSTKPSMKRVARTKSTRKLKFGSPAWRKKYMTKRRSKR